MNKKKLLALLMALVMTLSLVPVTAFATTYDITVMPRAQVTQLDEATTQGMLSQLPEETLSGFLYSDPGNLGPLNGNLSVTPETAFIFEPVGKDNETTPWDSYSDYSEYQCDFVVTSDEEIAPESLILGGYYGGMLFYILSGYTIDNDHPIYLMQDGAKAAFEGYTTYNAIVNQVQQFVCTAINLSKENIGKTISVSLVMWNPTDEGGKDNAVTVLDANGNPCTTEYTFTSKTPLIITEGDDSTGYYHVSGGLSIGGKKVSGTGSYSFEDQTAPGPHFAPEGATTYVAQIGEDENATLYETLQEAFNAAQFGDTVKLLDDVDATGAMYNGDTRFNLWIDKSITLDGDGHTLTVKGRGIGVQGASDNDNIDVTIKNITVKNVGNVNGRCVDTRGKLNSLTLENATLTTAESSYTGYLQPLTIGGNQSTPTTVTIKDSHLTTVEAANKGYAITTFNPVNMTVTGSTIKGWACFNLKGADSSAGSKNSVITVSDSTLVSANGTPGYSNSYSLIKIEDDNIDVTITDTMMEVSGNDNLQSIVSFQKLDKTSSANCEVSLGGGNKVTLEGYYWFARNMGDSSKLSISGGIFNVQVPEDFCADGYICVANPDTETNTDYPYMVKAGTLVAEVWRPDEEHEGYYNYVGGYETLQAAIDAAADGDIVELLADVQLSQGVDVGKDVTLDLNGKTISNASDITTDYLLDVLHGGTLTVDDSSEASSGKISMDKQYCAIKMTKAGNTATFIANNPSTLIVNAGTIEGPNYAISGNGNDNRGNSVITINGGTIRSTAGTAIYQPNTGVVTLNGGTITGLTGVEVRSGSLNIPANSTAVITGTGTPASISGNGNGTTTDGAGVAIAQHTTHHDIDVAIAGGTISGQYSLAIVNPNNQTQGTINASVTGGKFSGNLEVTETRVSNFISGGIFSSEPDAAYIATGYQAIANTEAGTSADYPYTIGKVQVTEKADATVTVTVDKQVDFTDSSVPQVVKDNSDLKASINTNTSVSGVALTNNLVGGTNGLQDVVNAAEVKKPELTAALTNATTVEVKVDVTVVPKEYDAGKTFTFSLTPTATVTTKDENGATTATVSGVEVDNTMIDQTQDIEVTLYTGFRPALLTHRDDQGNVIGSYTKGDTASDSTFTYDDATGTCKLIIHHFSTIEATASSGAASVEFEGGSLRRRVWRGTQDVVSHETDFRMKFAFSLPVGAQIELNDSYFYWSTSNENPTANDRKVKVNSIKTEQITVDDKTYSNWAALILTGVPRESFGTTIYCKLHLVYTLNDKTYEVEVNQGVSVNDIANYLAGLTDTPANRPWIDYGHYLLQDEHAPTTYNINAYNNNN